MRVNDLRGGPRRLAAMAPAAVVLGLLLCAVALLAGCTAGTKEDLRYRQSRLLPPLEIPEGLDAPRYAGPVPVPRGHGTAAQGERGIEYPPDLLAGQ